MTGDNAILQVRRASGALGAVVTGVDLRTLDDASTKAVRDLLLEHLVLSFPEQFLNADEQRTLSRRFGTLEPHLELPLVLDGTDREVAVIDVSAFVSDVWHLDYDADFVPTGLATLNAVVVPDAGGDTVFVNNARLYDELSLPMRDLLAGLTALHVNVGNTGRSRNTAEYPFVVEHPETRCRTLLLSCHHVQRLVELSEAESAGILSHLQDLATRPELTYRHHWEKGTLCLWDNRSVQHYAVNDAVGDRLLYRVTVAAERPRSVGRRRWPAHRDEQRGTRRNRSPSRRPSSG